MTLNEPIQFAGPFLRFKCPRPGLFAEQQIDKVAWSFATDMHGLDARDTVNNNIIGGHFRRTFYHLLFDLFNRYLSEKAVPATGTSGACLLRFEQLNIRFFSRVRIAW